MTGLKSPTVLESCFFGSDVQNLREVVLEIVLQPPRNSVVEQAVLQEEKAYIEGHVVRNHQVLWQKKKCIVCLYHAIDRWR